LANEMIGQRNAHLKFLIKCICEGICVFEVGVDVGFVHANDEQGKKFIIIFMINSNICNIR